MSAKRKRDKRTVAIVDVRKRIEQRHKEFLTKKLIGHHGTTCEAIVNEMCLVKSLQFMPPGLLPLIASFVPGIITTWREIADAYAYNLGAAPVAGWEMHVQLGTNVELRGFATPDDKGECRIDIELSCPCTDADMIRLVFDAQPDHRFFFFTTEDTGKQQQQKLGPWAKLLQPHLHHSKLSMLAEIMSCKKYDISGIRHKLDPKNGEVVSVSFLIDGIIGIDGSFPLLAMPPEAAATRYYNPWDDISPLDEEQFGHGEGEGEEQIMNVDTARYLALLLHAFWSPEMSGSPRDCFAPLMCIIPSCNK